MDPVFQQAPFDDKKDTDRIKEVISQLEQLKGWGYGTCDFCNRPFMKVWTNIMDLSKKCIVCYAEEKLKKMEESEKALKNRFIDRQEEPHEENFRAY